MSFHDMRVGDFVDISTNYSSEVGRAVIWSISPKKVKIYGANLRPKNYQVVHLPSKRGGED